MFKQVECKVFEIDTFKGHFIVTFKPLDIEEVLKGVPDDYKDEAREYYKSKTHKFEVEYRRTKNETITSFCYGGYKDEKETFYDVVEQMGDSIFNGYFEDDIQAHKELLDKIEEDI